MTPHTLTTMASTSTILASDPAPAERPFHQQHLAAATTPELGRSPKLQLQSRPQSAPLVQPVLGNDRAKGRKNFARPASAWAADVSEPTAMLSKHSASDAIGRSVLVVEAFLEGQSSNNVLDADTSAGLSPVKGHVSGGRGGWSRVKMQVRTAQHGASQCTSGRWATNLSRRDWLFERAAQTNSSGFDQQALEKPTTKMPGCSQVEDNPLPVQNHPSSWHSRDAINDRPSIEVGRCSGPPDSEIQSTPSGLIPKSLIDFQELVNPSQAEESVYPTWDLLRLITVIVGSCLAAEVGLALVMAFTLTTTKGNLLYALIVHGKTEVHVGCNDWEQLVTCSMGAEHPPLLELVAMPHVIRHRVLETTIWFMEAATVTLGTRLLFPYHWGWCISVIVVGLQVLSYGGCLIHVHIILQEALAGWGLMWGCMPLALGLICCLLLNSACPAEYKLIRTTKELCWAVLGIHLAFLSMGMQYLLGMVTKLNRVHAAPAVVLTIGLRLLVGLFTFMAQVVVQHLPNLPKEAPVAYLLCLHIVCQTSVRRHVVAQSNLITLLLWSLGMVVAETITIAVPALLYRRKIRDCRTQQKEEAANAFELRAVTDTIVLVVSEIVAIFQVTMLSLVLDPVLYQQGGGPNAPMRLLDVLMSFGIQISLEMLTDALVVRMVTFLLGYRVAATVDTLFKLQGFYKLLLCVVLVTCWTTISVNWNLIPEDCFTCSPMCPRSCDARWPMSAPLQNNTNRTGA